MHFMLIQLPKMMSLVLVVVKNFKYYGEVTVQKKNGGGLGIHQEDLDTFQEISLGYGPFVKNF